MIFLIIYGIDISDSPYKDSLSHLKVFFIVLLLSICFFFIWIIIKPNPITRQTGIVPFPPSDTLVPVDDTQCGLIPTSCKNSLDCETLCKDKEGKSYYSCHVIDHPNTYYLGTKLEVGKSYCLPNINELLDIQSCGTYTGRIVWAKNPDGTLSWQCQCLYPDLFSGPSCIDQRACQMNYKDSITGLDIKQMGKIVDSSGNVWWSKDLPIAPPPNSTPYDTLADGTPKYQCSCKINNKDSIFYRTNSNPFVCNQSLCYAGESETEVAKFNLETSRCVCTPPNMYQSNISGFCYPIEATEKNCNLNTKGDGCKYGVNIFYTEITGNDPKAILYKNNNRYYMSDKKELVQSQTERLLDITDIINNNNNQIDKNKIDAIVDITNSVLKEAFYSFPVVQGKLNENVVITDITSLLKDDMRDRLSKIVEKAANGPDGNGGLGLAQLCNSYYYRRDGYPQCNDPLSKTGTQPIVKGPFDCGIGNAISHSIDIDNYPYGYHCVCGDGAMYEYSDVKDIKGEKPNKCFACTKPGEVPENKDDRKCCVYYTKRTKSNPDTKVGLDPSGACYHFNITDDLARNRQDSYNPNYSCQNKFNCPGNFGCGYMDENDNDKNHKVCCPRGTTWSGTGSEFYSDWCSILDSGMRCKHDFQCKNGTCKDGKCN
jgi:hypothetical protein